MTVTPEGLEIDAEKAFWIVWYLRSRPDEPTAQSNLRRCERDYPEVLTINRGDGATLCRWEGRMATLRHLADGGEGYWDDEGAFDS